MKRVLTWGLSALFLTPALHAQHATPAPSLDLTRLPGVWFEVARLPDKAEKHCVSDATLLYALNDKPRTIQIVATCRLKDGSSQVRNTSGKSADKIPKPLRNQPGQPIDGRFNVPGLPLLHHPYWVLALAPDYTWSLVGTPNHKSLWLLSKSPTPPPTLLPELTALASAQGFPVAKLIPVPHTP